MSLSLLRGPRMHKKLHQQMVMMATCHALSGGRRLKMITLSICGRYIGKQESSCQLVGTALSGGSVTWSQVVNYA
jgi:hypothetical protein